MVQVPTRSQLPVPVDRGGFSLRHIATVLYRRRFIILAIAAPLIIIGGINLFGEAGTYTASTRVVAELERVDIPKWNPNSLKVDYDRVLNTYIQSAMSMPVAQAAARALQDSVPTMIKLDEKLVGLDEPGELPKFLLDGLNVSVIGESAILDFRFTSSAPRISLMAVRAMRDAFLEFQVHGRKNGQAVGYYQEQMVAVRASIDSLLGARGDILEKYGYSSFQDELKYDTGQLANLEGQLIDARVARRSLQSEYDRLKGYLKDDPRKFPMGLDQNRSSTLVNWMNTVAKHDDEMNSILSMYSEDSSQARRQQALIDESVKNLLEEEEKYGDYYDRPGFVSEFRIPRK